MIRRLMGLVVFIAIAGGAVFALKDWFTRTNQIDLEIAACNKIQDPIARAAAYEADPDAARAEAKRDRYDIGDRLALAHLDTKAGDFIGAAHNMEVVVKLQPQNRAYEFALCGLLFKVDRTREAVHRLENMALTKDQWGTLARAELDKMLPPDSTAKNAH